ncbi:hypothetical protein U1Q18_038517 [Sarracenia purpurea var. burkii]
MRRGEKVMYLGVEVEGGETHSSASEESCRCASEWEVQREEMPSKQSSRRPQQRLDFLGTQIRGREDRVNG